MLEIFNNYEQGIYQSLSYYPSLNIVSSNVKFNLSNVINYCRSVEGHGVGQHNYLGNRQSPLVTLIQLLDKDFSMDRFEYFKDMTGRALGIANKVGLVTLRNPGQNFKDMFYTNSNEFVLYTENYINLEHFKENWKVYRPLRVIYSQDHDLDFEAREHFKDYDNKVIFYELDVRLLMMMYREWGLLRLKYDRRVHPHIFLTQVVYPNMLLESTNVNIFNRIISYIKYGESYEIKYKRRNYPFYCLRVDDKIDKEIFNFLHNYKNRRVLFGRLINSSPFIPILDYKPKEPLYYLRTNIPLYSMQTSWVMWCSRLPYFRYMLELLGEEGLKYNRSIYTTFQKEYLLYRSRGVKLHSQLPEHFKEEILDHMEYIRLAVFPNLKI